MVSIMSDDCCAGAREALPAMEDDWDWYAVS